MSAWLIVSLGSAIVVLAHVICVAAHLSRKRWQGKQAQFIGLALSYALVAGGAAGVTLSWNPGVPLLLLGIAGWILFDRRKHFGG